VQWLETIAVVAAAGDLILASLNGVYFFRYARRARALARRVGASTLCLLNAGLAIEASVFLVDASGLEGWARSWAVLFVRAALLLASALVALLILRHGGWHRP
jgi:hypothetical protein